MFVIDFCRHVRSKTTRVDNVGCPVGGDFYIATSRDLALAIDACADGSGAVDAERYVGLGHGLPAYSLPVTAEDEDFGAFEGACAKSPATIGKCSVDYVCVNVVVPKRVGGGMGDSSSGGKTYLVCVAFMADGNPCTYVVNDVENVEFMGRPCIKGRLRYSGSSHFMSERVIYIPHERVISATEYESYEAYKEAIKCHYAEKSR